MNETIFFWFYRLADQSSWLTWLVRLAAGYLGWFLVIFLLWQLIRAVECRRSLRPFVLFLLSALSTTILVFAIKHFYLHPRPFISLSGVRPLIDQVDDNSFPSS